MTLLGLKDLIEYIDPESGDMPLYECTLCNVYNNSATVITHIIGFKHRVNYLVCNLIGSQSMIQSVLFIFVFYFNRTKLDQKILASLLKEVVKQ